ncbi:MAG: amino acid adenylation domain-containing protein, partial [Cyclobacteriaceae bacterium]
MVRNLVEAIKKASANETKGITFIHDATNEDFLSYSDLYLSALRTLSLLRDKGLKSGDELVIQVQENKNFVTLFWACILGSIVPVPISTIQNDTIIQKLIGIWKLLNNPWLIASAESVDQIAKFSRISYQNKIGDDIAKSLIRESELSTVDKMKVAKKFSEANEDDIAFIQFSSGSTGNPKGVMISHRNLISNMEAIGQASSYKETDTMLSWMPLTHDMGLIGFHLNPLLCGMNHCLMQSSLFLRKPNLWLEKAEVHRASILCSPNFGYSYFLKHFKPDSKRKLDLSQIRIIYNGAEPISRTICDQFTSLLSEYRLSSNAICPVYGLAEATLAVTISEPDNEVVSLEVESHNTKIHSIEKKKKKVKGNFSVVNVGTPVDKCSIRIVDDLNEVLEDGGIGYVQIKGVNVTSGYYNNEEETAKIVNEEGWLNTGDLGFINSNNLFITGRSKDVIFVNGQNYYPHDIEQIAEEVEDIELNKIAVSAYFSVELERQEIIAFVVHRGLIKPFASIARTLRKLVNVKFGISIDRVIPIKRMPKTTSGKLQRFKLVEMYEEGAFANQIHELELLLRNDETENNSQGSNGITDRILGIWKTVLGDNTIKVSDSFFEIGGTSLKASEICMLIHETFQTEISLVTFYENPTILKLSNLLSKPNKKEYSPIPGGQLRSRYKATSAQQRLYFDWIVNRDSTVYNLPIIYEINKKVDPHKVEEYLYLLIQRHDSLRMSLHFAEELEFEVSEEVHFSLTSMNCKNEDIETCIKSLIRPFDLSKAPLFRAAILEMENSTQILVMDFHHIISDGLSIFHFLKELSNLLSQKDLQDLRLNFRDFAIWEQSNETYKEPHKIEYWKSQLFEEYPLLELPTDHHRPQILKKRGRKLEFNLGTGETSYLKELAIEKQCSLHSILFTIYRIFLSKITGQDDIVIGIPTSGRSDPDLLRIHGMFVNTIPIRVKILGNNIFDETLEKINHVISSAVDNQIPLEDLVSSTNSKQDRSRNLLFDTMFVFHDFGKEDTDGNLLTKRYYCDPGNSKFDLTLEFVEEQDSLKYYFEYSTELFEEASIRRFQTYFKSLIDDLIGNLSCKFKELAFVSEEEQHGFDLINSTEVSYPKGVPIHNLFDSQVKLTPNSTALEHADTRLTYKELNEYSDGLAQTLKEHGISNDSPVVVLLPGSIEFITSILAILKSGGCYVPIDQTLPSARISQLIMDSGSNLVVSKIEILESLDFVKSSNIKQLSISSLDLGLIGGFRIKNAKLDCNNLAYIIYTSGTSGAPKGVRISHDSLVNYCLWAQSTYFNDKPATMPLFTSISYDLAVTSFFVPLISGGRVIIYNDSESRSAIESLFQEDKADVIKLTPSHLAILGSGLAVDFKSSTRLKCLIVGGEKFDFYLAEKIYKLFNGKVEIYNEYGPTEATVGCMIYKFSDLYSRPFVPIGKPIQNTKIYVLDKFLKPVPTGVNGQLCIAGLGLSNGYHFDDDLTKRKFVNNPFQEDSVMYCSGDICRRLPNGVIDYIGRVDDQVKINGYRVELSEIEHALLSFASIQSAAVKVFAFGLQSSILCAYYVSQEIISEPELKKHLFETLPFYMVPTYYVHLDHFPLTPNGKLDKQSLPDPDIEVGEGYVAPETEVEGILCDIW